MGYAEVPQTTAMREGLEKDDKIAQIFLSEMEKRGYQGVTFENCVFLSASLMGFLGHLQTE